MFDLADFSVQGFSWLISAPVVSGGPVWWCLASLSLTRVHVLKPPVGHLHYDYFLHLELDVPGAELSVFSLQGCSSVAAVSVTSSAHALIQARRWFLAHCVRRSPRPVSPTSYSFFSLCSSPSPQHLARFRPSSLSSSHCDSHYVGSVPRCSLLLPLSILLK